MTPKAPRICFNGLFLQDPLDGIGNYCFYLIQNLIRQHPDWKLSLLVNKPAARHFRVFKEKLEIIEIDIASVGWRVVYLHAIFPFRTLRFDLLHSIANVGPVFCPVPQIITVHDTYEYVRPDRMTPLKRKQFILTKALSGKNAAFIIADSKSTQEDLEKFYPGLRGKSHVIHLGSKFPIASPSEEMSRKNFLAHGTLDQGRNLTQILQAYARYSRKDLHKLVLFGVRKNGKEAGLPALLQSLGIENHVTLLGYISDDELMNLYRTSLAFVRAQDYDGFGLPAVEAMSCGCPTILAYNSSLVEVGGDAALFFETHNVEDLTAKMESLNDAAVVRNLVQKSLAHARNFTWEENALRASDLYLRCLNKTP